MQKQNSDFSTKKKTLCDNFEFQMESWEILLKFYNMNISENIFKSTQNYGFLIYNARCTRESWSTLEFSP